MTSKLPGISAAAVVLLASGAFAAEPAALVKTVCASCHKLDVVTQRRDSKEGWRQVVKTMVQRGAPLTPEESVAVTEYLAKNYHDQGKELVESVCILCHDFARISSEQLSRDQWAGEIRGMLAEGAPLTDEEFELVLDYLTKTYGKKQQ